MVKNSRDSLLLQARAFETNVKEMIKGGDFFSYVVTTPRRGQSSL
jgi:hypothetical protein